MKVSYLVLLFLLSCLIVSAQELETNRVIEKMEPAAKEITSPDEHSKGVDTYLLNPRLPVFPYGQDSLRDFVASNLDKHLLKKVGKEGLVYASFEIGLDSVVQNIEIVLSLDPKIDKEVTDAIMQSPKWYPAVCCSPSYVKYDPQSGDPEPCEYCVVRVRYPFEIRVDQ